MYIQKYTKVESTQHLVIVGTKKSLTGNADIKELPFILGDFLKVFLKSDKKSDYLKSADSITYFIKGDQDAEKLRVAGSAVQKLIGKEAVKVQVIGEESAVLNVAEGIAFSNYQFIKYLKDFEKQANKLTAILVGDAVSTKRIEELNNTIKAVFWARDMVNEPVSHLNAVQLSEQIEALAKEAPITVQILEKSKIEALKMGGLLAVNKGSIDPPTFTIVEYKPKKPTNKKPIVLVGKGVVYDTGGLSLKPTPGSMDCMKSDMAGAACVVGAVYAAALNNVKTHIIALVPATDNRPGLNAYAPGDIVTMYDGTTVEVLNTDAEGRMILGDALAYSKKFDPELVIDAATLTGAALRAIGHHASIIMGNADDKYFNQLEKAGNEEFERVVRFPFWDEYYEEMKSPIADLKNIGGANAGMITAGKFLEHFVKAPYIHMDIAGPAWLDAPVDYKGKGGTGSGVRLLLNFVKNYK
ncbi:MAG: leucyl aminopeptidase [Fluviicola sp.]|jgi:leucyl aminopeptidase|nr:leucyl aminopeptidase [Fluviicola sp.]